MLVGLATLLACAATVLPIYHLARTAGLDAAGAWSAAALWPLMPAAVLFQPAADAAFPLLSASALVLALRGRFAAPVGAGVLLAVGMQLSLVFAAVGLVVGLAVATDRRAPLRARAARDRLHRRGLRRPDAPLWVVSGANPLAIWWANQRNHGRFYVENTRSWLPWQAVNAVELAVAVGVATTLWAGVAAAGRSLPRVAVVTLAVLLALQLSGRNLGEVGRLWLPLMPPLVLAGGAGLAARGAGG